MNALVPTMSLIWIVFLFVSYKVQTKPGSVCLLKNSLLSLTMLVTSVSSNIYSCGEVRKCKACRRKALFKLATSLWQGATRYCRGKQSVLYALLPSFIVLVGHSLERNGRSEWHLYEAKLACSIAKWIFWQFTMID